MVVGKMRAGKRHGANENRRVWKKAQKHFFFHFEIDLQYICKRGKELLLKMPSLIFVKKNRGGAKPGVLFHLFNIFGDTKYPGFELATTADSDACTDKDEIL